MTGVQTCALPIYFEPDSPHNQIDLSRQLERIHLPMVENKKKQKADEESSKMLLDENSSWIIVLSSECHQDYATVHKIARHQDLVLINPLYSTFASFSSLKLTQKQPNAREGEYDYSDTSLNISQRDVPETIRFSNSWPHFLCGESFASLLHASSS